MASSGLVCEDCGESFPSRNKLFGHIRSTHDEAAARNRELDSIRTSDSPVVVEFTAKALYSRIRIAGEDDLWYSVVVKPQGLATMGRTIGCEGAPTLMSSDVLLLPDAIKLQLPYKKSVPCHRLDLATGGIVLCSKSKAAEIAIKVCFRNKLIRKRYRAIVPGRLEPPTGIMDAPIGGKKSLTRYSVVCCSRSARYGFISTVDLWPITGRRHQLRKHLMLAKHPILGDKRYSKSSLWPERIDGAELMFLWALEIDFPHPEDANRHLDLLKGHLKDSSPVDGQQQQQGDEDDGDDDEEEEEEGKTEDILMDAGDSDTTIGTNASNSEDVHTDSRSTVPVPLIITDNNDADDTHSSTATTSNFAAPATDIAVDATAATTTNDSVAVASHTAYKAVVSSLRRVVVSIDEPTYYAKFREFHQSAWEASQPDKEL